MNIRITNKIRRTNKSKELENVRGKESYVVNFLKECDAIFSLTLNWIIFVTPFAVCSLIASAIGKQDDLAAMFKNIGALVRSSWLYFNTL